MLELLIAHLAHLGRPAQMWPPLCQTTFVFLGPIRRDFSSTVLHVQKEATVLTQGTHTCKHCYIHVYCFLTNSTLLTRSFVLQWCLILPITYGS